MYKFVKNAHMCMQKGIPKNIYTGGKYAMHIVKLNNAERC